MPRATCRPVLVLAVVAALGAVVASLSSCLSWSNLWRKSRARLVASDVVYVDGSSDDKHRLDVWAPDGARGAPVVIFVHGGYWRSGDRHYFTPVTGLYGNVGVALGDMDVVTVVPSYRLFPTVATVEPMLDDLAAAIRWTHDHVADHGGDPDRIVLAGHSAGGHLLLQLVTAPEALASRGVERRWVKGVAPVSGIFDVVRATRQAEDELRRDLWQPLFGHDPEGWSPLRRLGAEAARTTPMLFLVGSRDYPGCLADFASARAALRDVEGSHAFFRTVPGRDHAELVLQAGTKDDEVMPAVAAFARAVTASSSSAAMIVPEPLP